jgi:hypothetical protein
VRPLRLPQQTLIHNLMAIGYGGVLLVWLSTESTNILLTSTLGFGLGILIVGLGILHRWGGRELKWPAIIAAGAVLGICSAFTTFFLMIFKNTQHSHVVPDFSSEVVFGILARMPAWGLAGALVGGAIVLILKALPDKKMETSTISEPIGEI